MSLRIKPPNFIKHTICKSDLGSNEVVIRGFKVQLPWVAKSRDLGKVVYVNLNKRRLSN